MRKIISDISKLKIDDLKWFLDFGFPKKKGSVLSLRFNDFRGILPPVFFLSTGRCGTMWFTELLKSDRSIKVLHNPVPNLAVQGKFAYQYIEECKTKSIEPNYELISEIFLAGREEYFRYSYKTGRRIIETNNAITFFAPVLAQLFPDAKFVHLYRHPAEFVRSGIRRNYYNDPENDQRRIVPIGSNPYCDKWESFSEIEKVSWLWYETNSFIEDFKKQINPDKVIGFNFNQLEEDKITSLLNFLKIDTISKRIIKSKLSKPLNVQSSGRFPKYENWDKIEKQQLRIIVQPLAEKYGISLL